MREEQARKIVEKTFEQVFDKGRFVYFIKNLLNFFEEKTFIYKGNTIPKAFQDSVRTLERVGQYKDPEGKIIDILIVLMKKERALQSARSQQRNFISWYLKSRGDILKDGALVAFVAPNGEDWRFSFVKMEYKFDKQAKIKEEWTPARRYSFLVGKNEVSHTAQSSFISLLQNDEENPSLEELEQAFSVERVTKEFFEKYRELFHKLKDSLDKVIEGDKKIKTDFSSKGIQSADFAKKLLGQIVFLYFLQKKGWFGVERGKEWGTGSKHFLRELFNARSQSSLSPSSAKAGIKNSTSSPSREKAKGAGTETQQFFNNILEPLFYEALGREHEQDYYSRFDCRIPFLNGGLFEPINGYDWIGTDIFLPDSLFSNQTKTKEGDIGDGILDIFDRYNFTVREDEPLEKEVAIDPEMLGKVFENLLEVRDRKSKGTYYTPREIVHYMCQQSLINYLFSSLSEKPFGLPPSNLPESPPDFLAPVQTRIQKSDIEIFIKISDSSVPHDTIYQKQKLEKIPKEKNKNYKGRYSKSKMPKVIVENASLIDQKLASIKICDPAVGSGAFPVGMMNEVVRARTALTPFIKNPSESAPPEKPFGLPPASLNPAEFAKKSPRLSSSRKARLSRESGNPESSRSLRASHSLRLSHSRENGNPYLLDKGGQGGSRSSYHFKRHAIEHSLYGVDIDPSAIEIAKLRLWLSLVVDEEDRETVQPLPNLDYKMLCGHSLLGVEKEDFSGTPDMFYKKDMEEFKQKKSLYFNETRHKQKQQYKQEIEQFIDKITKGKKIFDFEVYFSEVFHEKGGFDVVIANPPYIEHKKLKGISNQLKSYQTYSGTADLYVYFYEIALNILRKNGVLTYISSNKFIKARYGVNLRSLLSKHRIYNIVDFTNIHIFNALVASCILIISKSKAKEDVVASFPDETFVGDLSKFIYAHNIKIPASTLGDDIWHLTDKTQIELKNKIKENTKKLGAISGVKIFRGVTTGYNPAFIIDEDTRKNLIKLDKSNKDIIKPLLQGRNIKEWTFKKSASYLLLTDYDIDISKKYPFIFQHLEKFKKFLIRRADQGRKWWNLRACKYYNKFEQKKIIWGLTANEWAFTWDEKGHFLPSNGYILTSEELHLKYILALMNSKLMKFYFSFIGIMTAGGAFTLKHETIYNFPIKIVQNKNQKPLIDLVDKILNITKAKDYLKNPTKQAKVQQYEKQIDQLIYKLYNLTPSEIKIIEDF